MEADRLIDACMSADASRRPSAEQLVVQLQALLGKDGRGHAQHTAAQDDVPSEPATPPRSPDPAPAPLMYVPGHAANACACILVLYNKEL